MRVKLVLNPIAGRGRAGRIKEEILSALDRSGVEYEAVFTGQRGAGRLLAKQAVAEGFDLIIAAGGDGTVNEVVNGMAGSQARLGVIPLGTGNDFAMMMGMPKDPAACVERILHGPCLPIDLCRANDRFFASSVGVGYDGEVAYAANHSFKHLRGMIVYILSVLKTIPFFHPHNVRMVIDGETMEQDITIAAVTNSRTYAGGMRVAPDAVADDGMFDICVAEGMSRPRILIMLPRFIKGTHLSMPEVTMYRGREITLESKTQFHYHIDGEVLQGNRLVFRLIPKGLLVAGAGFVPTLAGVMAATMSEQR